MVLVFTSETRLISLSLALVGCHVFEVVEIDCASDEPCARKPDADTDTDTDADTDTDVDTGPLVAPTRGWVISGRSSAGNGVLAFSAEGEPGHAWTGLGSLEGPVAYDPASDTAVIGSGGQLHVLGADDSVRTASTTFAEVLDLSWVGDTVFVATRDNLVAWDPSADSAQEAFPDGLEGVVAVGRGPEDTVYATDTGDAAPDLYQWGNDGTPTLLYQDFDQNDARAGVVFAGPDDSPHVCSSAGAIYAVRNLVEGVSRPLAYYDSGLTDVSACGYDPGDGSWLLFSPSAGVIRLDAQSRGQVVYSPGGTFTLVRASFF
jgi:hypothetical protein